MLAVIRDATRMLGTIKKVQLAVGVLANIVHVHTVMWQNEGVTRTMDKANGNIAVFYTINGDCLGKIVANCALCEAFCKEGEEGREHRQRPFRL